MQDEVKTIEEAMNWFLSHPEGSVTVVNEAGERKECSSFPQAQDFLKR